MFDHILTREREVFWQYGEVTCAAFSLKDLDSVSRFSPTISRAGRKLKFSCPVAGKFQFSLAPTKMPFADVAAGMAIRGQM